MGLTSRSMEDSDSELFELCLGEGDSFTQKDSGENFRM